ncbi:MAG: LysM peptidoglycan-binding domain-containing protein [Hespellia sp.]|nr:LysM peptidoglycan-binding domain-containing protein [Hespellia sp.]
MSEKRLALRRKRRVHVWKQRFLLSVIAFAMIVGCSFAFSGIMTSAHDKQNSIPTETSYISIQIESGDSLWSIAEEYKPVSQSTNEYISELIRLNGLTSEDIHADQYLTVACYETTLM